MCNGPLLGKIIIYYIPLMLSGILQLLFNAADIVVVGQFAGDEALAAVGSTSSLINLLVNVFIGLSVGTNVLVARFYGAGQKKELSDMVHTSILTSLVSGVFLIFVGIFLSKPILEWMATPADVIGMSVLYIRIYFAGMPVMMLWQRRFESSRGYQKTPLLSDLRRRDQCDPESDLCDRFSPWRCRSSTCNGYFSGSVGASGVALSDENGIRLPLRAF